MQRAVLGCKVDGGRHKRDSYTHPDAEVIAATVAGLPDSLGGIRMALRVTELARAGLDAECCAALCTPRHPSKPLRQARRDRNGRHRTRDGARQMALGRCFDLPRHVAAASRADRISAARVCRPVGHVGLGARWAGRWRVVEGSGGDKGNAEGAALGYLGISTRSLPLTK